jgi:hypothetical protein
MSRPSLFPRFPRFITMPEEKNYLTPITIYPIKVEKTYILDRYTGDIYDSLGIRMDGSYVLGKLLKKGDVK